MAKPSHYLVLDPKGWLPEDEWSTVLGATVKNPLNPTDNYTPDQPLTYNKERLQESEYKDFILGKETERSRDNHVELKGLGKLRWARKVGNKFQLDGKVIYVKRLRQHEKFWKAITANNDVFKQTVTTWVKERDVLGRKINIVCIVVGLLMCEDVVVAWTNEEIKEHEQRGDLPLGTVAEITANAHGIPITLDGVGNASAGTATSNTNREYFSATQQGKRIFALQLRIVKTRKDEIVMTNDDFGGRSNYRLGHDEEEEDDPVEREMDEGEWEILLQRQEQDDEPAENTATS